MTKEKKPLRDRLLDEAIKEIAAKGVDSLSLRDVARRLGVSHQAPYKHFATRDHLIAAAIKRCLREFAHWLDQSEVEDDPISAMRALGDAYINFALERPREYRLMFSAPWPELAYEESFQSEARASFDILCRRLERLRPDMSHPDIERLAMFVWSSMHGIAGVLDSGSMHHLGFPKAAHLEIVAHIQSLIEQVILFEID